MSDFEMREDEEEGVFGGGGIFSSHFLLFYPSSRVQGSKKKRHPDGCRKWRVEGKWKK